MQTSELRLECLKLAHRPDRSPAEVIAAANEYLEYLSSDQLQITAEEQPADGPKEGKKKSAPNSSDKPL